MKIIETIKSYIWAFYIIIFKKYKGHSYLAPIEPEPGNMIFYSEEDGKFYRLSDSDRQVNYRRDDTWKYLMKPVPRF